MNKTLSLLTAIMVAGLMACGNKENGANNQLSPDLISNPATGSNEPGADGTVPLPEFSFEYDQHHFGVILSLRQAPHVAVPFLNTQKILYSRVKRGILMLPLTAKEKRE